MVQSKKTRKTAFMLIKVNDTNLYYEVHGNGTPIILVHGNSETHKIFDVLIGELKKTTLYMPLIHAIMGKATGQNLFPTT